MATKKPAKKIEAPVVSGVNISNCVIGGSGGANADTCKAVQQLAQAISRNAQAISTTARALEKAASSTMQTGIHVGPGSLF